MSWQDIYAQLGITKEDMRLHSVILRGRDRQMCSIAKASDLIEAERDITNRHCNAMKFAVDSGEQNKPLTVSLVLQIHQKMFPYGGEHRGPNNNVILQNHCGDPVQHQPLPGSQVGLALYNWCKTVEQKIQNPTDKWYWLARLHIEFEQIHPFVDGNGRVGRALLNYMAARQGLPLIKLNISDKHHYITHLNNNNPFGLSHLLKQRTI